MHVVIFRVIFFVIANFYDASGRLQSCETTKPSLELRTWVPVIDIKTHTGVYLNAMCAEKNGIDKQSYEYIGFKLNCYNYDDFNSVTYVTSTTLTSQGFDKCEIEVITERRFKCIPDVRYRCSAHNDSEKIDDTKVYTNVSQFIMDSNFSEILITYNNQSTFQYNVNSQTINHEVALCNSYIEPMIDLRTNVIFKNAFCAICSGITPEEIYSYFGCLSIFPDIDDNDRFTPTGFRLLITPSTSDAPVQYTWALGKRTLCYESQLFNINENTCIDVKKCDENVDLIRINNSIQCTKDTYGHEHFMLNSNYTSSYRHAYILSIVFGTHDTFARISTNLVSFIAHLNNRYAELQYIGFHQSQCSDMTLHKYPYDMRQLQNSKILCVKIEFLLSYDIYDNQEFLTYVHAGGLSVTFDYIFESISFYFVVFEPDNDADFSVTKLCSIEKNDLRELREVDLVTYSYLDLKTKWVDSNYYVLLKKELSVVTLDSVILYMYQDNITIGDGDYIKVKISASICSNHILVCDALEFERKEFEISSFDTLTIKGYDIITFRLGINALVLSNKNLVICSQSLIKDTLITQFVFMETIITITGGILSMLGYLGTFGVYWCLPSLHKNVCGKCIMALVGFLFIGHTCLLLSSVVLKDHTLCQYIGVIQHFAWLSSMCWMNCGSLDIWFTFRKWQNMVQKNRLKIYHCIIYSVFLPSIIVGISVAFDKIKQDHGTYGYGGYVCWIVSEHAIILFFLIPMGIMLCCSIAFG